MSARPSSTGSPCTSRQRRHRRRARLADREAVDVEDLAGRAAGGLEDERVDVAAVLLRRVGERRERLPGAVRGHARLARAHQRVAARARLVLAELQADRAAARLPADRPAGGEGHARADRVVGIGGGRDRGRAGARGREAARSSCRPRGRRPPPGAFPRSTRSPAPCSPGWSSRRWASRSSRSGSLRRPTRCAPPGSGRACRRRATRRGPRAGASRWPPRSWAVTSRARTRPPSREHSKRRAARGRGERELRPSPSGRCPTARR